MIISVEMAGLIHLQCFKHFHAVTERAHQNLRFVIRLNILKKERGSLSKLANNQEETVQLCVLRENGDKLYVCSQTFGEHCNKQTQDCTATIVYICEDLCRVENGVWFKGWGRGVL